MTRKVSLNVENEKRYLIKRIWKAKLQSLPFYLCRIFPIREKKITFCCIEGTTGYTCNPKYIAEEFIQYNRSVDGHEKYELVWLVNDITKSFPNGIKVVRNTLWLRAYHLATAGFWIDNSRKQLEVRKRKGQIYIQTWHAKLGFKPTCLDRGASFSKIAYMISKHDSDMVDYWLSNSDWYDKTLSSGSLYAGKTLRTGSPRCDALIKAMRGEAYKSKAKEALLRQFEISEKAEDIHFLMYAPTFRGGSQSTNRELIASQGFPDYEVLLNSLEKRFGGTWKILLRLHPQLVVRNLDEGLLQEKPELQGRVINASRIDDMYEMLAGCEAFMTDYSSAAFDAAVMEIPVFLYADDYQEYERERGKLLWDLRQLPFPLAVDSRELKKKIEGFDDDAYRKKLKLLFEETGMLEEGDAAKKVLECILSERKNEHSVCRHR